MLPRTALCALGHECLPSFSATRRTVCSRNRHGLLGQPPARGPPGTDANVTPPSSCLLPLPWALLGAGSCACSVSRCSESRFSDACALSSTKSRGPRPKNLQLSPRLLLVLHYFHSAAEGESASWGRLPEGRLVRGRGRVRVRVGVGGRPPLRLPGRPMTSCGHKPNPSHRSCPVGRVRQGVR